MAYFIAYGFIKAIRTLAGWFTMENATKMDGDYRGTPSWGNPNSVRVNGLVPKQHDLPGHTCPPIMLVWFYTDLSRHHHRFMFFIPHYPSNVIVLHGSTHPSTYDGMAFGCLMTAFLWHLQHESIIPDPTNEQVGVHVDANFIHMSCPKYQLRKWSSQLETYIWLVCMSRCIMTLSWLHHMFSTLFLHIETTLPSLYEAKPRIVKHEADDYFVFLVSDANLRGTPGDPRGHMVEICLRICRPNPTDLSIFIIFYHVAVVAPPCTTIFWNLFVQILVCTVVLDVARFWQGHLLAFSPMLNLRDGDLAIITDLVGGLVAMNFIFPLILGC